MDRPQRPQPRLDVEAEALNQNFFAGTSGRDGDVFDPNTGQVQARISLATEAELDAAVQSAAIAQKTR